MKLKRIITALMVTLALSPLSAQMHLDVSPYLWFDLKPALQEGEKPLIDDLYDWYTRPPLANLTLKLTAGYFNLFGQLDVRSDLGADLSFNQWSNLPGFHGGHIYLDPNLPQTAYIEYRTENLGASFGRRKIDWGPGSYTFGISEWAPYFDHAWFDISQPFLKSRVGYQYLITTSDTRATMNMYGSLYKTLTAHLFYYKSDRFIFSLMDFNLVWDRVPDLQEISPLALFHGLYQKNQNVALSFSLDFKPKDNLRLYTELFIDDYQTSIESEDSQPGGMGALAGGQFLILEGKPFISPLEETGKHTINAPSHNIEGGLALGWEILWASQYLYNRAEGGGKFTNPVYYMWTYVPAIVETYYGAAYGPDRIIGQISLQYESSSLKSKATAEYHLIGADGINGLYAPPYDNWITLSPPVRHMITLELSGEWEYRNNQVLMGTIKAGLGHSAGFQFGMGWGTSVF
jgi:hypothetical protein